MKKRLVFVVLKTRFHLKPFAGSHSKPYLLVCLIVQKRLHFWKLDLSKHPYLVSIASETALAGRAF